MIDNKQTVIAYIISFVRSRLISMSALYEHFLLLRLFRRMVACHATKSSGMNILPPPNSQGKGGGVAGTPWIQRLIVRACASTPPRKKFKNPTVYTQRAEKLCNHRSNLT